MSGKAVEVVVGVSVVGTAAVGSGRAGKAMAGATVGGADRGLGALSAPAGASGDCGNASGAFLAAFGSGARSVTGGGSSMPEVSLLGGFISFIITGWWNLMAGVSLGAHRSDLDF